MKGILSLTKENLMSAVVYGGLFGLLAMGDFILEAGSVFNLNWKALVDSGIVAGLAVIVSLIKNLLTTNSGNFLGKLKVIPPIE